MNELATIVYLSYVCLVLGLFMIHLIEYKQLSMRRKVCLASLIMNTSVVHFVLILLSNPNVVALDLVGIVYFDLKIWLGIFVLSFLMFGSIFMVCERNEKFKAFIGLE
ncbi:MAG TPA: hypothetical protein DCY20_03990 [Firmicutes bacterium]|nr:hypothetical protein [Bacillota bacterium]